MESLFILLFYTAPLWGLGLWIGLAIYFTRLFNRKATSSFQRFGNGVLAMISAGIITGGVTIAILLAACPGFKGL